MEHFNRIKDIVTVFVSDKENQQTFVAFMERLRNPKTMEFRVSVGLIVVLLVIDVLGIMLLRKMMKKSKHALIIGCSGGGKTALLEYLRHGNFVETQTSQVENEDTFLINQDVIRKDIKARTGKNKKKKISLNEISKKKIEFVDVPGNEKLRHRFTHFVPVTHTILFVVDASKFDRQKRAVADYLYDVLTNPVVLKRKIPVLLVVNKIDLEVSMKQVDISLILELELNEVRKSRKASPEAEIDGNKSSSEVEAVLGDPSVPFTWKQAPVPLRYAAVSVKKGTVGPILDWIDIVA